MGRKFIGSQEKEDVRATLIIASGAGELGGDLYLLRKVKNHTSCSKDVSYRQRDSNKKLIENGILKRRERGQGNLTKIMKKEGNIYEYSLALKEEEGDGTFTDNYGIKSTIKITRAIS